MGEKQQNNKTPNPNKVYDKAKNYAIDKTSTKVNWGNPELELNHVGFSESQTVVLTPIIYTL